MSNHLAHYKITDKRLFEVFNLLERHIEERYGVKVVINDVADPFTGDLNGAEIHLEYDQEMEGAAFSLIHLFGHTVQWNTSARARVIADEAQRNPTVEILDELEAYEREACCLSLQLLHEAGVYDLDQWVSDFAACDFRYLRHFYTTGEKALFLSLWEFDQPLLKAVEIPPFDPAVLTQRLSGIVV